jgi:arylsulfatase A-like enzyme/uncharacterized membrane protein YbhN (UPF0104 family)
MKEFAKRYMRVSIIILGAFLFAFYGWKTTQLGLNRPVAPEIATDATPEAVAVIQSEFETGLTKWNNQFARKGFFCLIGLFIALLGILPKNKYWIPKLMFSSGLVTLIIHHLLADGKIVSIAEKGMKFSVFWIIAAFVVKGSGMGCTVWRWKVLLEGQGFKIPLKHLVQSFLIGRFIGSFAPGTSGLDGYRAYDISRYTGKVARSISVIFVEKLIGFFVLGTLLLISVPVGERIFAEKSVNSTALIMLGLFFSCMMLASMVLLFQPRLFRWILNMFIPKSSPIRRPFDKAIKAVTAYENRKLFLAKATLIGFGVHICTIGMYFCTARAIGQAPLSSDLFVTGALMIGATVLPLSIAGIGMREGVFAFFLGPISALYAFGGYLVGELISLVGGPVWLARRGDYYQVLKAQRAAINAEVEDDDDEDEIEADEAISEATGPLPEIKNYILSGLGAGLIAGLGVAIVDAARLWSISGGGVDMSLPGYGALLYGPLLGIIGAGCGLGLAIMGRLVRKPAAPKINTSTFIGLALFFVFSFTIGFFYLYRDVFAEKFGLPLLGSIAGIGLGLVLFCLGTGFILRQIFAGKRDRLANIAVASVIYVGVTALLVVFWFALGDGARSNKLKPAAQNATNRPNVLLVMNDTHRADFVGAYTGEKNLTPRLDEVAGDGVVFKNAFAQASWTRPSVSTILTGRYPSSHTATLKGSMLPDEITTLAEVLEQGSYETIGIATNYNLTPFFNFDQGFHDYRYLAPNLPLGSTDSQAKLIFIEVLKKIQARLRGKSEVPDDYYVIGETVTAEALARLDTRDTTHPFFMFLSYMDAHDPYFRHPFDGYGISHRGNPHPDLSLAKEMKELYRGEIKYWDKQFGKLVDGLKKRGLYENTLIVVVSDHGEEFGEHGGFWHGTTLYDEQLKIVFIVKYHQDSNLASSAGQKVDAWIRLLDVAPLIIEEAGLEIPKEMQGTATLNNPYTPVFSEEDHEGNVLTSIRLSIEGKETKLIRANKGNPRGLEENELYRTDDDPGEKKNVASGHEDLLSTSTELLNKVEKFAGQDAAMAVTGELSDEAASQLKALGYMNDDK